MPGATPDINPTYVNTSMVANVFSKAHIHFYHGNLLNFCPIMAMFNRNSLPTQGASVLKSVMKSKDITENLQKENNADNALTEENS